MSNENPVRSDCCPTCGTPKSVIDQMCSLYALHELLKERDELKKRVEGAEYSVSEGIPRLVKLLEGIAKCSH